MLHRGRKKRGFTLIELAIVLAVAGLMFVGLWRLLSSGNQQVRDQSAASQQEQLISAVKSFLLSAQGQTFLGSMAASTAQQLALPTVNTPGTCTVAAAENTICNFLPTGFISTTPNSYGQTYYIRVLKDATAAPSPPQTYSFLIVTVGGDTIPDTSGGRIAAFIGGDGGFIYTNNVCGAPVNHMACGSYGTWSVNANTGGVGGYGVPAANLASGHVASRTYVSPSSDNTFPWLARPFMTGDSVTSPVWNSMQTDFLLGSQGGAGVTPNTLWMGGTKGLTTGGGTLNLQGGTITGTGFSNIALTSDGTTNNPLIALNGSASPSYPVLNAVNGCTVGYTGTNFTFTPNGCTYSVNTDNLQALFIYSNGLYATTFIYTGSDIRLKSNIRPIINPLENVMKLKPVSYTYKSNGMESMGVIAQDLEKVYPKLVTQQNDGMKSVNYNGLIGPLIGAIQQLKQDNDDLRQQLRDQKAREDSLEQQLKNKTN